MSRDRTFSYPEDASRFPRSTKEVLALAHHLGWGIHWAGTQRLMARISAPKHPTKSINIPSTNMNHDRTLSILNQIRRYSDEEAFDSYADDQTAIKGTLHLALSRGKQDMPVKPPAETAVARALREAGEVSRVRDKALDEDAKTIRAAEVDDDTPVPERTVVSEKPWMVRKGGHEGSDGRMYESPHVQQRVWSDGFEDYACIHCGFTHESPRSVSAHASRSKSHPRKEDAPTILRVRDYQPTDIKRPMSAIRRLTSDIIHALDGLDDWSSMSPDELARIVAEHVYAERPDQEPAKPLTPEQIIARISLMVDDGRLADMHQKVEQMAEIMREQSAVTTAAQVEAEQLRAEVSRLHEERRALAAMLAEDGVSA